MFGEDGGKGRELEEATRACGRACSARQHPVTVAMSASTIHFKFRSVCAFSSVTFTGATLELKELKKLIVAANKLDKEQDFDLKITDAKTNTGTLSQRTPG